MPTPKQIARVREEKFSDEEMATDGVVVRHIIAEETIVELSPIVSQESKQFKKSISITALVLALTEKDKDKLLYLTDWSLVNYDVSRGIERSRMVASAVESWKVRHFLPDSSFRFDINDKAIDKALSDIIQKRIRTYNQQERKRLSVILTEGNRNLWSSERIAAEIKRGAGLNAVQQKALFNRQKSLAAEGLSKAAILKQTDEYIETAKVYREEVTAKWESESVVNAGILILGYQLFKDKETEGEPSKQWISILDQVTGNADRALHGQVVLLSENFVDPTLTYPPTMRPPLRGNCRCSVDLIINPRLV